MPGTVPLMIQLPIKAPTESRIIMGIIDTVMAPTIPSWICCQLMPRRHPTSMVAPAATTSAT